MNIEVMVPHNPSASLQAVNNLLYLAYKYQLMWALRDMEQEMEQQNGVIRINQINFNQTHFPQIQIEGFNQETTTKIRAIIANFQFEKV